jgi:hypothetical protein
MSESYTVKSTFTVVDELTPVLERAAKMARELNELLKPLKEFRLGNTSESFARFASAIERASRAMGVFNDSAARASAVSGLTQATDMSARLALNMREAAEAARSMRVRSGDPAGGARARTGGAHGSIWDIGMAGGILEESGRGVLALPKAALEASKEYEQAFARFKELGFGDEINKQVDQRPDEPDAGSDQFSKRPEAGDGNRAGICAVAVGEQGNLRRERHGL